VGLGRVKERDENEGIWLMDFISIYRIENKTSCNYFRWGGVGGTGGGDLRNVQLSLFGIVRVHPPCTTKMS
jgi:hypothetical protein